MTTERPYDFSNGSEFMTFYEQFCDRCTKDQDDGCALIARGVVSQPVTQWWAQTNESGAVVAWGCDAFEEDRSAEESVGLHWGMFGERRVPPMEADACTK